MEREAAEEVEGRVAAAVEFAVSELERLADPSQAPAMAAYLKTDMPFHGVKTPARRPVLRDLCRRFPPRDADEYRRLVVALWELPHREEKYLAIGVARHHGRFVTMEQLDLYERLIRQGAWWDLVDGVAADLVGRLVAGHRAEMRPVLERWIDDPDMWVRRAAIISGLGHGGATDREMLFDFCLRRADEKEFFIRKAIGWALRQYARTDPEAVRAFVDAHADRLSPLSRREATKHLLA